MSNESLPHTGEIGDAFDIRRYLTPAAYLALILILGIALRLYELGKESYWIDEIYTITESQQSIYRLLTSGRLDQPPAYYLPFHLWMQIMGTSEAGTRLFSVITGVGSIVLIYWIGRELFSKEVGLLGAFILAISEYQILFSQETRFYTFFEFMTLLSILFYIRALRSGRPIHFVLYGASTILMLYSHTFGVFTVMAQNLFFVLQARKYRELITSWLISQIVIVLAFGPYLALLALGGDGVAGTITSNTFGNPAPSLSGILRSVYLFVVPPRRDLNWEIVLGSYALAVALLAVSAWLYARNQGKSTIPFEAKAIFASLREPDVKSELLLLTCWLVLPMLLASILSVLITPIYAERYMIGSTPALYLLLAAGIYRIRRVLPVGITLAAFMIVTAPGLSRYYGLDVHEEWREAAAYLADNSQTGDVILFAPEGYKQIYITSLNWYYHGDLQSCGLANSPKSSEAISAEVLQCISGHDRFWMITNDYSDVYRSFFLGPDQTRWPMLMRHPFVNVDVYLFEGNR